MAHALLKTGARDGVDIPPDPLRWHPIPLAAGAARLRRRPAHDGASTAIPTRRSGVAVHLYGASRPMGNRAFVDVDGELLLIPQEGALRVTTELGVLHAAPGEIVLLPRGMLFKVDPAVDGESVRGYVCENYGAAFRLPELGPIGSNGLANTRDFHRPARRLRRRPGAAVGAGAQVRRRAVARAGAGLAVQRRRLARQPRARTSTTRAASTRSARSASTIPIRRSSRCSPRRPTRRAGPTATS